MTIPTEWSKEAKPIDEQMDMETVSAQCDVPPHPFHR
jgi:hypothetical protein